MTTPVHQALALGQSIWYDGIRRSLLTSGELEHMVKKQGLRGMTSNPSIFDAAIAGSSDYSDAIAELRRSGPTDAKSAYESLAIADIRAAADIFRPVYDESGGDDGYVSMEVSPELAHDTSATVAEAKRLWAAVDRPNLMVKVPGTEAGIPAIQALVGAGINVNVTLLFGLAAYESAAQAYMAGLEDRLAAGAGIASIASVASIFISRLDSAVEPRLDLAYAGKVAIANAKVIYEISRKLFSGKRWNALAKQGARSQRLLWASTSTKNPALPELLYVEALMGPDTVDTVPPATFEAFAAHGTVRPALEEDLDGAHAVLDSLSGHGVELSEVLDQLVAEAVEKFATAFRDLLSSVERALGGDVERAEPWRLHTSLPRELADQVDGVIDEWRSTTKVARIWAHDATVWTGKGEDAWLGWLGVALDQEAHGHRFDALVKEVRTARFADAVVLGMGGSSLCPDLLAHTFPPETGLPRLLVLDSTDPGQVRAMEERVDLAHTLFFVSSKSGATLEPNIFAAYFYDRMAAAVGSEAAGSHFIAITDPGSPLEALAKRQSYRAVYFGVPSIGGRYSALSDFGMVPGAACGVDVGRLFSSAEKMAHACAPSVPAAHNPGLALGAVIGTCVNAGRNKVTLLTSPAVAHLGAWLEQLLAESTGKLGKGVVPVDSEPLGEPSQYGADRLFCSIALGGDEDAEQAAKITALEEAGHPVVRIELSDLYDLGGELFRWEFATAVAGSIIGIDPFDQPDVEEAKVLAHQLADRYDQEGSLPELSPLWEGEGIKLYADDRNGRELTRAANPLSSRASHPNLVDFVRTHLARARSGDYVALLAYVQMAPAHEAVLTEMRTLIRDTLQVATCVGFGPRFQHSTGQTYKGGPNTGVFFQITCDDAVEVAVPGHRYSFGVVKEAEARGDLDVLASRGRRALRVHLGADVTGGLEQLRAALNEAIGVPSRRR
ncbi:MAG: bifunctional transaldolase/phosoglucose isomerase [Actinomycetota bacterium]|nr:bifunctional transaldolase/phosoglucose isomerase [Actinomycetota bacterium]